MKASDQTLQQIKRAFHKVLDKFPPSEEALPMTDILLQVNQDTGDLMVYDDNDKELTRVVIEEWISNTSDTFYDDIQPILHRCIGDLRSKFLAAGILKPYNILLLNDDGETVAKLYEVSDDTIVIGHDIIKRIDDDLDKFLEKLMKEE